MESVSSRTLTYMRSEIILFCKNLIYTVILLWPILSSIIAFYSYRCNGDFIARITSWRTSRQVCSSTNRLSPGHCLPCKKNTVHDRGESEAVKPLG